MRKKLHIHLIVIYIIVIYIICNQQLYSQSSQTFNYSGSIEYFTVPSGIFTITIEAKGAQGGNSGVNSGGLGAKIKGDFNVTPGQQLKIMVGQQGGSGSGNPGGGGGSFVTDATNNPYCIAGGGGGSYKGSYSYKATNSNATTSNNGMPGINASSNIDGGAGGNSGNGGECAPINPTLSRGAGGGGLITNGSTCVIAGGGQSFINGGSGGLKAGGLAGNGGYGGGGGGDTYDMHGSGGGGGYSGGGGGYWYGAGGGGGSFNNGFNQDNIGGFNSGNGSVVISWTSCDGKPYAGDIQLWDSIGYCSMWVNIPLMNPSNGPGISYQWQSANDNSGVAGVFSDIPGENMMMFHSMGALTTTKWYRCVVLCSASGLTDTTREVLITILPTPNRGNAFSEFTNGSCILSTSLNLANISWDGIEFQWQSANDISGNPGSFTDINLATNNFISVNNIYQSTWYRCKSTCTYSGISVFSDSTKITISPTPETGSLYATNTIGDCSLNTYLYLSGGSIGDSLNYKWQSAPDLGGIPGNFTDIAGEVNSFLNANNITQTTWYRCIVTCTYSSEQDTSNQIQITINQLNGGNTVSTSTQVCVTENFTLSLTGNSTTGVEYQWQTANDNSGSPGTFTDISGAISSIYTTTISSTTWFRCKISCNSGSISEFSLPVKINNTNLCYCSATAGCDEHIKKVIVGNIDNTSTCSPSGYGNYLNISTSMTIGNSYPLTVTNGVTSYGSDQCGVWIDWNQDGDFYDADETISVSGTPGSGPYTSTIIPPATAISGNTRMRIRIMWTGTLNPCGHTSYGEVEDYTIYVNPAAAYASVTIASDFTTVCQGTNVNLTATPNNGGTSPIYQWQVNGANVGTNSNTFTYTPQNGDNVICIMNSNLPGVLSNPDTSNNIIINVNPLPSAAGLISGSPIVCQGEFEIGYFTEEITDATSYIWTLPSNVIGSSSTRWINTNIGLNAQSGLVTVKGHNACGDGPESTLAITVNPLPSNAGIISGDVSVCKGDSNITYTITPLLNTNSYKWNLPNGVTGISTTNSITVDYSNIAVSGNISVYGINDCGNGVSSQLFITVNSLPIINYTANPSVNICLGNSLTLNGTGASTYDWSGGIANGVSFSPTENTTYTVTGTDVNGCLASKNVSVTIGGKFNLATSTTDANCGLNNGSATALVTGNNILLSAGIIPYTASTTISSFYGTWDLSKINDGNLSDGTVFISNGTQPYEITMTFTSAVQLDSVKIKGGQFNGDYNLPTSMKLYRGTSTSGTLLTTITPTYLYQNYAFTNNQTSQIYTWVVTPVYTGHSSLREITCYGLSENYSILWSPNTGSQITPTATNLNAGNYSVTVSDANNCSKTENCTVIQGTPASIGGTIEGSATVCAGINSTLLTLSGHQGNIIRWQASTNNWASSFDINHTANTYNASNLTTSTQYRAVVQNGSCSAVNSTSVTITVNPLPANAGVINGLSGICNNQNNVNYNVTPISNATTYIWTLPSGAIGSSTTNSINIDFTSASSGNITVKGNNSCGNGVISTKSITVSSPSTNPISISGTTLICSGNSTTLSVVGGSLGTGASWKWYSESCGGVYVGSGSSITVWPNTNTTYYVRAENDCGNTSCVSTTVNVNTPSVAATSITGNASYCYEPDNTMTLSLVGGSLGTGASWKWYSGSCGGTLIGTGLSITINPSTTTTYYVRAEGTCNITSCQSFTVTVNSYSTSPVSITGTVSQCSGVSSTLSVSGGTLGSGASWKWYTESCGGTLIGSGSSITISPTSSTTYYVRGEGICNTTNCASRTIAAPTNQSPVLSYTGNIGYTDHLVSPSDGTPTNIYRFEVKYSDPDGGLPAATYPRLYLDFEGNGNYAGANDKLYYMLEVDPTDLNTVDGKHYYYIATTLPESADWKTMITANDAGGCSASIGPLNEPNIIREADISIFANDISFSDANPDPGDIITVSAVIHNYSGRSADNFVVHLVNQFDPAVVYSDITVAHLGAYSSTTVSWNITTPALPAWCPMQVFIDYTNVLTEPNELDNQAIRPFTNGNYTLPGKIVITATPSPATVAQYSYVNICGNAWYTGTAIQLLDSSCAGATVTYTVVETGQTGSTYTNSLGNYCVGIYTPYPAGTYHVNMHITDYTLNGDTSTMFNVFQVVCPDLSITNITMGPQTLTPNYPCHYNNCVNILHGQSLSGSITVTNSGNASSIATTLKVDCPDGVPAIPSLYPIPALNPGATYTIAIPSMAFNAVGGTYINATVDYGNLISECNESNSSSQCIMVHPDRDIVPSSYIYGQQNECSFNSISVLLDNPGGQATGAFNNRLKIYNGGGVLDTTLYIAVSNIPALHCTTITFNWPSPHQAGNYSFVFDADYLGAVSETNEANNTLNLATTLFGCKADLYVYGCYNLKVEPVDPQSPGNISIYATIVNNGLIAASNFVVNFNVAGIIYPYNFIGSLNSGQSQEISITVPTPAYGCNTLIVTADANNIISESNEINNSVTEGLYWDFRLDDFGYICYGSAFWNHTQIKNQPVVFDVGLHNSGLYKASNVEIKFEVSGPGLPAGWLDLGRVSTFSGSGACVCPFAVYHTANPFAFPQTGTYQVRITVDPDNDYAECNEGNNVIIVNVHVTDMPDYRVLSQYIAPSKLNPELGEPIGIDITYENIGMTSTDSLNFKIKFNNTDLYTVRVPGLMNGIFNTVHVLLTWSSTLRGIHIIRTIIDSDNEITENNELNNEATRAIIVGQSPNLLFTSFTLSDTLPAQNTNINISATIKNIGYDICDATYSLYYLNNNDQEVLIGSQPISLDTSESVTISVPWTVIDTKTTIIGRINNGDPVEYDITDNEARQNIGGIINLTFAMTPTTCNSFADGKAKVIIGGAQPPYSILWNTGQTADSITGPAGIYSVTVTDINGLTANNTVQITEPSAVSASISIETSSNAVCPNKSIPFYATPTNGGSTPFYQWKKNGINIGTNSSVFTYTPANGDTISCIMTSNLSCASNNPATSNIIIMSINQLAADAGIISGSTNVCEGQLNVVYTVPPIANATTYFWTLPSGATGSSNTNTISVNYADTAVSGNITVKGGNTCGYGEVTIKAISVNELPYQSKYIYGPGDISQNQNGLMYTCVSISNANDYIWTLPNGMILDLQSMDSIYTHTNGSAYSGLLSVRGQNSCGLGPITSKLVKIPKKLNVKLYLEGFFNISTNLMNKVQDENGDHFSESIVDSVTIEVRSPGILYLNLQSNTVYVNTDGNTSEINVPGQDTGVFYIAIKHRNHIETWSKLVSFNTDIINYDFTTSASKAYGNNLKMMNSGKYAIFSGDINQDGLIDGSDMSITESNNNAFVTGYQITDVNGDGLVDGSDMAIVEQNNNAFVNMEIP